MRLDRIRYYEDKLKKRIHQSSPREYLDMFGQSATIIDPACAVGPYARHSQCRLATCACGCHQEHEWWGD